MRFPGDNWKTASHGQPLTLADAVKYRQTEARLLWSAADMEGVVEGKVLEVASNGQYVQMGIDESCFSMRRSAYWFALEDVSVASLLEDKKLAAARENNFEKPKPKPQPPAHETLISPFTSKMLADVANELRGTGGGSGFLEFVDDPPPPKKKKGRRKKGKMK